jgi:hypothetical protein
MTPPHKQHPRTTAFSIMDMLALATLQEVNVDIVLCDKEKRVRK